MAKIKDALREFNPWWKGAFEVEFKDRNIYGKIQKFLPLPQMVALTGLRRTGKTTLMLKIADDAIKKGYGPLDVIYFSFDEFPEIEIREIIEQYEEITGNTFRQGKRLLLLDEIQKLNGWENQLKAVYDTCKNTKIMISGSESLFIRKKSKEALAGRIFEFTVEPLLFNEFLAFKGLKLKPTGLYEKELRKLFDEFALTMGFPELVGITDREIIKKYVKEGIVEKVVYRDLAKLFKIKDISVMDSLLRVIMEEPGQIIELSGLAHELNISRQTLSGYLGYLEKSFMVRKLYNFSRNRRKIERKLKKYYPAMPSVSLLFSEDDLSRSRVFEWLVIMQLKAEFFWRDPYKNEVDAVLVNGEPVPVEVKYGKIGFRGIEAFMKKFNVDRGCIISRDEESKKEKDGKVISIVPAFKFFLNMPGQDKQKE
ncbi:MAG: ATP-binding protein [Sedimentisphaerales bacterium]